MKLNRIGFLIKEGFGNIFTHRFMSFASVTIIVACLLIMGSFTLVAINIDAVITELEHQSEVMAFVDESLSEKKARALETELSAAANVREVKFVSREEARDNYISQYEDPTIFEDIEAKVFRHRYVIYLDDITQMTETVDAVRSISGIADVNDYSSIEEGFVTIRNVVSAISLALIVLLLVVSVFIMANTIKLASFTRREEIAIMKIVGASNWFIRFPFVVEGLVLGLLGGGIAFGLQWGLYDLVNTRIMTGLAAELFQVIPFQVLLIPVLSIYLVIGILVGIFGGNIAIRNYLKV
ncbi:MAG: permease-like cell division protein FtsX [Eubacteriales bacterium]|nr:permease-like cell division protein FtsX [Eubacteriales bacterium]